MQLILDTETTIDIKRTMSTLNEESLVEKLDDVIQELKSDICNSNKENIQSQDNIIISDDKELNSDNDKENIEEISAPKSPVTSEREGTEIVTDDTNNDVATENCNQQIPTKETQDIVHKEDSSEPTFDKVEHLTSSKEICSVIDQEASSEPTIDTVEQQASSEEIRSVIDERASSEPTLDAVEQHASSEGMGSVIDERASSEPTLDEVEQHASSEEMGSVIDERASSEPTLDAVEQHASSEEICTVIDQPFPSEVILDVVEQEVSSKVTLETAEQQAPSEGTLETVKETSSEDASGINVQHAASKMTVCADDYEVTNKESLDVDDQQASKEKSLGVDNQLAVSEEFLNVDERASSEKTFVVDDLQASSEKFLGVDDQQSSNKSTVDVENHQSPSEETLDVDHQQSSSGDTRGTVQQQTSSEKSLCVVEQQASNEDILDVGYQQSSSEETFEIAKQKTSSAEPPSVIGQQDLSEKSLNKVDDESEKDDDSDPIVIAYENETHTEAKERPLDEVREVNTPSENPVQKADNIIITDNCATSKAVEIVELDDEEKEDSTVNSLKIQNESTDTINDGLLTNNPEPSMAENDKSILSHSKIVTAEEKEKVCVPMEVDNNSENCDTRFNETTELISENKETTLAMNEKNNILEKNDKDLPQTTIIDTDVSDTLIKSADCEGVTKKEELIKKEDNSECNKIIEVDEVVLQVEKSEESINNKNDTLSPENKITSENKKTEIQAHCHKLSEDFKNIPSVLKLSNTLDILSDDEDIEPPKNESQNSEVETFAEKQCINIEDDDDIMLIDEDTNSKDNKDEPIQTENETANNEKLNNQIIEKSLNAPSIKDNCQKEQSVVEETEKTKSEPVTNEKTEYQTVKAEKPLVPSNFLKSYKKNLADMTREDLEEFCILKIVESIVDRSNLSDIKAKLKTTSQNIEEYKKKAMMLTKQNRDLQVVLKSIQEEQRKTPGSAITPLKITRSVGMQVLMTEKPNMKRKVVAVPTQPVNGNNASVNKSPRTSNPTPRPIKPAPPQQTIPVPRLVPASNNVGKNVNTITQSNANNSGKAASPLNGIKTAPVPKVAEKRPLNKVQSMTVDLTDDEPPAKVITRSSPVAAPPVRLLHPLSQNSPRKVYIPISGPPGQNIRPGQTIMLKSVPTPGPRPRGPIPTPRLPQNQIRMPRIQNRHPAPLPEVKQYQTNHYKALPPAPDLKLSKVENGIVISWKIEGYQEDSYEEIASYQLYAYQESSSPPSTALWKKIGDVKALPLPMACTLTQFMAGFKYYFAVRAVDVRSRFGPFSLPGSILLLNKI